MKKYTGPVLALFVLAAALPVRLPAPPSFAVSGVRITASGFRAPGPRGPSVNFGDDDNNPGRFAASNDNGVTKIAALTGAITLNYEDGRPSITINVGTGAVLDAQGNPVRDAQGNTIRSLAELMQSDTSGSFKESIMIAVRETAAAASAVGGLPTVRDSEAVSELAALMKVVAQADPAGAAEFVSAAVTALTANGAGSTTAIAAAIEGAKQGGATASVVTTAATSAAQANGVTVTTQTLAAVQSNVAALLTTTPVNIDVSVISRSN
jgi:hypothetical protein